MRDALRQLLNNLGAVILALLLAFVIWIVATLQDDPFSDQEFANVPVALLNAPEDTTLFEDVSDQVAVWVRAPESVLRDLQTSDFEATMDLSAVQPGTPAPVSIQVTCTNQAVRIQTIDPVQQIVHLEAVQTITLPVTIEVEGQVALGYRTTYPTIVPPLVAVRGPKPLLTQVVSVTGSLGVEGAREDIIESVSVAPLDADGKLVPDLQWTPDQVQVEVGVRKRLGYKPDVEVVPNLQVTPASGYRLGGVSVEPSVITLAGPPSVLDKLPGFVKTQPISVTGATETLSLRGTLTVPANVAVVGVNYVTVTIEVLPIESSQTVTSAVEIYGLREGWIATLSPSVVNVIVVGPASVLAELQPDDIQIILNLFGYDLGVYRLDPVVLLPEDVTAGSIIPETIEVVIEPAPTPTPTLTITPTLTMTPTLTPEP